ncbi:hypothetical protein OIU78_000661 [Salix suchowensis]|nr:hypothetical protein OIU78_000661 [Salix suchowensis]
MHKGKVKQIVGSTLRDLKGEDGSALVTNFESDETAAEFANLHKEDGLMGGADDLSKSIAIEQLFVGLRFLSLVDWICSPLFEMLAFAISVELCFAEDIPDLLAQLGKFANKIFPLLNLLRGFKKSRGLAGWRWYQCKQCFELRRGRSQPCYC